MTRASTAPPCAMLLSAAAESKVYPGRVHVLMIDSGLAPCREHGDRDTGKLYLGHEHIFIC